MLSVDGLAVHEFEHFGAVISTRNNGNVYINYQIDY